MIHACGLVEAAQHFVFSPGFVDAARAALRCRRADLLRCRDGGAWRHPRAAAGRQRGRSARCATRARAELAARARQHALGRRAGAVAASGSPARWSRSATRRPRCSICSKCSRDGAPKPAAIIGMPVGFVGAAESKEALADNRFGMPVRHRARPHGRQRHDGGRGQRAGEGRPVSAAHRPPHRRRHRPGRPGAADAEGGARARPRPTWWRISPSAAATAMPARIVAAHPAARGDRAAAALSGDHRDRQGSRRLQVGDRRLLRRSRRDAVAEHLARRPHGGGAERGRPAVLRLLHAPACAAGAPLPDRGHPRRHRHVRLLVAGRPADRPGRRRAVACCRAPWPRPSWRAASPTPTRR